MSLNNNFINKYYLNNKLNRLMHDNEAQLSYFTCLWVTVCLQVGQILQAQQRPVINVYHFIIFCIST